TGAWVVRVRDIVESLADPAVQAAGVVRQVEAPCGGRYRVVVEPLKMDASPLVFSRPAPGHGEHTRVVLADLGYAQSEIERMIARGAAGDGRTTVARESAS